MRARAPVRLAVAALLALPAFLLLPAAARAEKLVTSLSTDRVQIASNFTGAEIAVFGSIDLPAYLSEGIAYDVVVTVLGPRQFFTTRRKERVLGLWVNVDSREFVEVPAYLAVLANRPLAEIADEDVQRRERLGIANVRLLQRIGPDYADTVADDAFRQAFVRIRSGQGLYSQTEDSVSFLTGTVFRATIPLPPNVPTGRFDVEVKVFAAGQPVARDRTALEISKVGFEHFVGVYARDHALLYGLAVALMALGTGWLASVIFRRD
ncbi:MAG: TIGR02186 family protein [Methylacidiphilales bacterium]|nr:TIGR02186 family protein [Candidatus Methylacidiphilales bacterium]